MAGCPSDMRTPAYLGLLLLGLTGCGGSGGGGDGDGATEVTVNVGHARIEPARGLPAAFSAAVLPGPAGAPAVRVRAAVAVEEAFPYLGRLTLAVSGQGVTSESVNTDFNDGRFTVEEGAIVLTETRFALGVPSTSDLTFVVTGYNRDGYRVFRGTAALTRPQLALARVPLNLRLASDVDEALPRFASSGCADSDGDGLCDVYEDVFVNASGSADLDGDGLVNSLDTDSDGDNIPDGEEGLAPVVDGYPAFVVANRPPQAIELAFALAPGESASASPTVVDPDPNDRFTLAITVPPAHGSASVEQGVVYYQAPEDFAGSDPFTLRATDRGGLWVEHTVPVTVSFAPANQPPVTQPLSFSTGSGTPVSGRVAAEDPDGDALSFTLLSGPSHGTLEFAADGSFTYRPADGYSGSDGFSYQVSDGSLSANGSVVIEVRSSGSGGCVTLPRVAVGTTAEYRFSYIEGNPDIASHSQTQNWVSVSDTAMRVNSRGTIVYTDGDRVAWDSMMDFHYHSSGGFRYSDGHSSETTSTFTGSDTGSVTSAYSSSWVYEPPGLLTGPETLCAGASWDSGAVGYTFTNTFNGQTDTDFGTERLLGTVEAVGVPVTTPAGSFDTVRFTYTYHTDSQSDTHTEWVDIATGVVVRWQMTDSKAGLVGHELVSLR